MADEDIDSSNVTMAMHDRQQLADLQEKYEQSERNMQCLTKLSRAGQFG